MPAKTVKTKRSATATKKPTAKKATVKKPTAKATPNTAAHECACGAKCNCGANCACGAECKCGEKCACQKKGCKFCRVLKNIIVFVIIFGLGFCAAKLCCCGPKGFHNGPRVQFVNGCIDMESVKCPKLAAALPAMDINGDGCISREEYRAVKKHMRREIREMRVHEAE